MNADLKAELRLAERGRQLRAFALVAPLLTFLVVIFVLPIGFTMFFAVASPEVRNVLPRTAGAIADWDGSDLPDEATFEALVQDLQNGAAAKTVAGLGTRLNYEISGYRSLIMRSSRRAKNMDAPYKDALIERDPRWGELEYWRAMKTAIGPLTPRYLLQVLDLERSWDGSITRVSAERAVYVNYLVRTFWISVSVTVLCIFIGYPIAVVAAHSSQAIGRLVLAAVLLPFWISVLVRTAAWVVVLQKEGVINSAMIHLGIIDEPVQLIFNRLGVYVAMVHVLLPFLVLPLYSVMKNIPMLHMRAAESLGAKPISAFLTVYLPQSLPGLSAGTLLVFILSLGYYITPALVGGPGDQMLSYLVTEFALEIGNWGMAGAAAFLLLVSTLVAYAVFRKLLGARGFMA
ncbi:ABC transporter permease [Pelagibius sp.]|uniref:ABC transporter permease n=1 Tax=Pelagibius sp. TaxID=1931238 RepID=UPI003BAEC9D1